MDEKQTADVEQTVKGPEESDYDQRDRDVADVLAESQASDDVSEPDDEDGDHVAAEPAA